MFISVWMERGITVPLRTLRNRLRLAGREGGGVTMAGEAKGAADGFPLRDLLNFRPIDAFLFLVRGILY